MPRILTLSLDKEAREARRRLDTARAIILAATVSTDFEPLHGLIAAVEVKATCELILDTFDPLDKSQQDFEGLLKDSESIIKDFKHKYQLVVRPGSANGHVVEDRRGDTPKVRHIEPTQSFAEKKMMWPKGSHYRARLTVEQVKEIREYCKGIPQGKLAETFRELAKVYHCGEGTIEHIYYRRSWQNVE